jgi:hypothetical protein
MAAMNVHRQLLLTAEITVTDGHIDGTVRAPGQPGQMFSGWSELFGVLTRLVEAAGVAPENRDALSKGAS